MQRQVGPFPAAHHGDASRFRLRPWTTTASVPARFVRGILVMFACGVWCCAARGQEVGERWTDGWVPTRPGSDVVDDAPAEHVPRMCSRCLRGFCRHRSDERIVGPCVDAESYRVGPTSCDPCACWQVLPDGLIYAPYLAGVKEPRIAGVFARETNAGWFLDATLGGRVGLLRLGTTDSARPQGWQLDVEGAAFPRLNLEQNWDVDATDFRFGVPLTYGSGNVQTKMAYYHLSAHLGDELLVRDRDRLASRINFSRDVLVLGMSSYVRPAWRLYGEVGWGFETDGGSEPWEFQFGVEFSPPGSRCMVCTPFFAANVHLREEVDFGGHLTVQTGWQTRGASGHLFRVGLHYFNGKSNQFEFFDMSEQQVGLGLWYDY